MTTKSIVVYYTSGSICAGSHGCVPSPCCARDHLKIACRFLCWSCPPDPGVAIGRTYTLTHASTRVQLHVISLTQNQQIIIRVRLRLTIITYAIHNYADITTLCLQRLHGYKITAKKIAATGLQFDTGSGGQSLLQRFLELFFFSCSKGGEKGMVTLSDLV